MAKVFNSLLLLFIYYKEIQCKKSFGNRFFLINFKITCKYKRCLELKSPWNLLIRSCSIEKIEDLKAYKLHKPGFILRYHNIPAITGASAWNLIWGYFKAVVVKLLWPSTPSRVSWNFIIPLYFTFYVIVIEQTKKDAYVSLYFYNFKIFLIYLFIKDPCCSMIYTDV